MARTKFMHNGIIIFISLKIFKKYLLITKYYRMDEQIPVVLDGN